MSFYPRVRSGDPLEITADAWNALMDLLERSESAALAVDAGSRSGNGGEWVYARNETGAAVARFGVMGLAGLVFEPTAGPGGTVDEFKRRVVVRGALPDAAVYGRRLAVAVEPIGVGKVGRVVVSGLVQVKVNKLSDAPSTAGLLTGDATQLVSGGTGARVVYSEAGLGTRWAVVRLGEADERVFGRITALSNDSLTVVRRTYAGVEYGDPVEVLKPPKLTHVQGEYDGVTSLTTVDTNTVDIEWSGDPERWKVTPIYKVGDVVELETFGGGELDWGGITVIGTDKNRDGRQWAMVEASS